MAAAAILQSGVFSSMIIVGYGLALRWAALLDADEVPALSFLLSVTLVFISPRHEAEEVKALCVVRKAKKRSDPTCGLLVRFRPETYN